MNVTQNSLWPLFASLCQVLNALRYSEPVLSATARRFVLETVGWAVGSSATIDTTNIFNGTIMADQSVTLKTGSTLNGRALAWIGAVTLDTNTIVKP